MPRQRLAAWLTLPFGVLLVLLAISEQPGSFLTTTLLLLVAAGAVALWLLVDGGPQRGGAQRVPRHGPPRAP